MRCAREGADHGSERNTLGTNAEGVFMFARDHAMEPTLFVRGLVLGFTIAAAVGPISLLCIRRTLAEGHLIGLVSGMGVATADATYGAIAAFGLTAVTDLLVDWRRALGIVGGVFLLWLAWRTFRSVPGEAAMTEDGARRGLPGAYLSTLALTLTNPMTILSFAALFVGLGVTGGTAAGAMLLTLGVFAGSAAWWVVLVAAVGALRSRLTATGLRRVNVVSGLAIGAFAIVAIASAVA
jgi:threonine/homoserine/homoserine lactone efflux protein